MMPKRMALIILATALGLLLCAPWYVPLFVSLLRSAPKPIPIVIVRFQTLHLGLIHIVQAKGYFTKAGLTATVNTMLTGHEAIVQVLDGQADVGTSAKTPLAK